MSIISSRGRQGMVNRRRALTSGVAMLGGAFALACGGGGKESSGSSSGGSAGGGARPGGQSAPAAAQGTPRAGGSYTYFITANQLLDPHKGSASAQTVTAGVYSRLLRFKTSPTNPDLIADHDLENDLAVSVESPDAQRWTVKLRPDATFHNVAPLNGRPVEAEDVKATFLRLLDPATASPNRGSVLFIDPNGIETPDKNTVVFKLNYPYAPFPKAMASPAYGLILPREVGSGYDPSKVAIGSGPFQFESYTPDVAYIYKKNPNWHEKGMPYVDQLKLAIVPDANQQLAQFAAGNADEFTPDVADADNVAKQNPKASMLKAADGRPFPVYLQLGDPSSPFQDVRLRRALSMALDRESLGKAIFAGKHQIVPFVPAYMGKWSLKVDELDASAKQWFTYNLAESKKLLEASGNSNLQLKFAYISNGPFTTPAYVKQGETIANMFNQAGIKTAIIQHDYNKDYIAGGRGSRQGNFDKDTVVFSGIASYTEVDEHLYVNFHSKSTSNGFKLADPRLDDMIEKQRAIVKEEDRLKAGKDIQKYIADQVYGVSTAGAFLFLLTQGRVQNYSYSNSLAKHTETHAKLWLNA